MSVVDEEKPSGYNTCGLMKVLNLNTELLELPIIYLLFSPYNFSPHNFFLKGFNLLLYNVTQTFNFKIKTNIFFTFGEY